MRKFYWYLSAYIKKHFWLFIITVILALVIFGFIIPRIFDTTALNSRTYHVGLVGAYTLTNLPEEITNQISYGLTAIDPDNWQVVPAIAQSYQISDDGLTYTFHLKDDLYWQDGTKLTPDQINYHLPGVSVSTDLASNSIIYQLTESYAPFPSELTTPLIRYNAQDYFWGLWSDIKVIGIGDYQLTSYEYKDASRNKLSQATVVGPQQKIVYHFYLTEEQATYAFQRGEVDQVWNLTSDRGLTNWHDSVIVDTLTVRDEYLGLFFNLEDNRLNENVRQAFAYAIEKGDGDQSMSGPISEDSWAFFNGIKTYPLQTDRAVERLLASQPQEPLNFTLTTTSNYWQYGNNIKKNLEDLGQRASSACQTDRNYVDKTICDNLRINIELKVDNFPNLNDFQLLLIGQELTSDPDQYSLWHSTSANNFTHYKNTRVDALLEEARQTIDNNERTLLYQEFQQVFMEDAPVVFMGYLRKYDLIRQ